MAQREFFQLREERGHLRQQLLLRQDGGKGGVELGRGRVGHGLIPREVKEAREDKRG